MFRIIKYSKTHFEIEEKGLFWGWNRIDKCFYSIEEAENYVSEVLLSPSQV